MFTPPAGDEMTDSLFLKNVMHESVLRDAHVHLPEYGRYLRAPGLSHCYSLAECIQTVREASDGKRIDEWVILSGAHVERWPEKRLPEAVELDAAGRGRPVMVCSFELHTLACSTAALRAAGITADTSDPPAGTIVRRDGEPTGLLLESAGQLVRDVIPTRNDEEYRCDVERGLKAFYSYGVVELHEMTAQPRLLDALRSSSDDFLDKMKLVLYAPLDSLEEVRKKCREWGHPSVRFGGLKLFSDGTLNARTAYMLSHYGINIGEDNLPDGQSPRHRGRMLIDKDTMRRHFACAGREGFDVAVHALGDGAVRSVLDVYEESGGSPDKAGFVLRIEHAQFISEQDVSRFIDMRVIASLQPSHLLVDTQTMRRIYPQGIVRCFPLRDLIDAAYRSSVNPRDVLYIGSDAPVVDPDPADIYQAALYRKGKEMGDEEAVNRAQAITEDELLSLMKINGS